MNHTFENPDNVVPKVIDTNLQGSDISLTVQPQSLTVLTIAVEN